MSGDKHKKPESNPKSDKFEKAQQGGQMNENKLPDFQFTPPPPPAKPQEPAPPQKGE